MFTDIFKLHSAAQEPARKRLRIEARLAKVTLSLKVTRERLDDMNPQTVTTHTITLCNERFETFALSKIAELKEKLDATTTKEKKISISSTIKKLEVALEKAKAADKVFVPSEEAIECLHSMAVQAVHWYPYYVRQTHYRHAPVFNKHGFTFVADVYYDWDSDKFYHYIRKYNTDDDYLFLSYTERTDQEVAWLMESISEK